MITKENYFKKLKFIKYGALSAKLKKGYFFVQRATEDHTHWDYYKDEIKDKIDEYFKELNEYLNGQSKSDITEEDAKDAAKDLIRHYVHRGDSLESLKNSMMGSHSDNYSAQIRHGKIEVDHVKRHKVDYKFPLAKIYEEVAAEKKGPSGSAKKEEPEKETVKPEEKKAVKKSKKPSTKSAKASKKATASQPTKKPDLPKPSTDDKTVRVDYSQAQPVEAITDEIKFIKRFLSLHNRIKTKPQIVNFINALQRAILEKRIRKSSKYSNEIMMIQRVLIGTLKAMKSKQKMRISENWIEKLSKIAGSARVRFSIQYLKRFIGIQGKEITKEKAMTLHNLIIKAMNSDKVNQSDPYINRIKKVLNALKQFISVARKGETLQVHEEALNGLNGVLGCLCQEEKKGALAGISELETITPEMPTKSDAGEVMSVEEARNREYQLVPITGKWAELIGKFSLPTQFFVYGLGGSGKSSFVLLFTQYLASLGFKILYVAGEQYDTPPFKELLNRLNITGGPNYQIVPKIDSLNPSDYDFVVLDSKDQLHVDVNYFEELRARFPEQSFIVLSQAIKSGSFTGKERWRNLVDVMIQAENGVIRTGIDKNRWGGAGEMLVFDHPSHYLKAG